ncbi:hypothetical protein BH23ACT2_BH23ACT2_00800 [soil metagenome]|jgi:hypothetical protein
MIELADAELADAWWRTGKMTNRQVRPVGLSLGIADADPGARPNR